MHEFSAIALRDKFLAGSISAVEITKYFLNRIEKYDKDIGAFLTVFSDQALQKAKKLDEKQKNKEVLGRLAAVPVAIKDNIHKKGEMSTCGSKFLTNYRAPFSATVTRLLEEEDAIIIGKTNLDEFAMGSSTENSALKKTVNPWNMRCTPGGSSGGSAAAVAARLCPLALGSDTGGSIRQPASLCGVVGFKPTYGRVSRYGLVAYGSSLDQIGPLSTTVEDTALVMEIIGKPCPFDSTSIQDSPEDLLGNLKQSVKGFKIGIPREFLEGLNPEIKQIFQNSLKVLQDLGAELIDIDLGILKYSIAVYYILATAEASTNLARFDGIRYALTSQQGLQSWWTSDCDVETKEGGRATFRFGNTYTVMHFEKLIPNQEVRWRCIEQCHEAQIALKDKSEWVGTEVIFLIKRVGPKITELAFTHKGLNPAMDCYEICENGWNHYLKTSLKGYIENGRGAIFQHGGSSHDIVNQYYTAMKECLKTGILHFDKLFFADDAILVVPQEKYSGKETIQAIYNRFTLGIEKFEIKRQLIDQHSACTLIAYKTKASHLVVEMSEWMEIKNGKIVEFRVYFDPIAWEKAIQNS